MCSLTNNKLIWIRYSYWWLASVVLAHLVFVLAVAVVVFLCEESLCFLVNKLIEEYCQERCSEGNYWIEVDGLPCGEPIIEETAHLNSHGDCGVHHGSICCHCTRLTEEHSACSHIRSGQNEAVDGLFVAEEQFVICIGHKEEDVDEGAEQLLEESTQEKVRYKSQLGQFKSVEVKQQSAYKSSKRLRHHVRECSREGELGVGIFTEYVSKCDGWVEVGTTDFPEENVENPKSQ